MQGTGTIDLSNHCMIPCNRVTMEVECSVTADIVSQRGDSPFVYRDGTGWPVSLPYIRKIRVSMAIGTQSGIRLHERVHMVKI